MAYPDASYLAPSAFSPRFRASWDAAVSRFLKIERRQSYNQEGDESYEAFRRGDHEKAQHLLRGIIEKQREMYSAACNRGVDLVRLRLVQEPLSDYLRLYEIPSYFVSQELGERIFIRSVDVSDDTLPDCIIFDANVMFVNAYDGLARLVGAIEVSSADEIDSHSRLAERLIAEAQPLGQFVQARGL